jgi:hypothetical protein
LLLAAVVGLIGGGTTRAEDRETSETVVRLDGPFVSVDFVRLENTQTSELVTCGKTGAVMIYDSAGTETRRWTVGGDVPAILRFKPSSAADAYAAIGTQGEFVFGSLSNPEKVTRHRAKFLYNRLLFSHDGKWLAAFGNTVVQFWRTDGWVEQPHENWTGPHIFESIAFLRDGNRDSFVTAGMETTGAVGLWSLSSAQKTRHLKCDPELDKRFAHIVTSPDSRWVVGVPLVSAKLVVWDSRSGETVARPDAFALAVGTGANRLAFSGDGKLLACSQLMIWKNNAFKLSGFKLFSVDGWKSLGQFEISENATQEEYGKYMITDLALDFTGKNVATLHGDGHIRLWRIGSNLEKSPK